MSLKWDKVEKKDELYKINGKRKLQLKIENEDVNRYKLNDY